MTRGPRKARDRVLHLSHTLEAGGAELALVRTLEAAPWDWLLQVPDGTDSDFGVFVQLPPDQRDRVLPIGPSHAPGATSGHSAPWRFLAALIETAILIRMHPAFRQVGVIFANGARSSAYGALLKLMSPRRKFVVHLRDTVSKESLGGVGLQVMKRLVLPLADGVIANSRHTLHSAEEFLRSSTRTEVVPSPIGSPASNSPVPPAGAGEGLRIGMVARLSPWKGQRLLVEAFKLAFPAGSAALYLIGGSAFGEARFEQLLKQQIVESGLLGRIHLIGHVDNVDAWIASMDICVQSSLRPEPMGQNILQYLRGGAAIVATDEGGPAEWIEHDVNGVLVQPRDAQALAQTLVRLGESRELRRRLASGARATELPEYEAVMSKMANFISTLAAQSGPREGGGRS